MVGYGDVNMDSDVGSISMSINSGLLAQLREALTLGAET